MNMLQVSMQSCKQLNKQSVNVRLGPHKTNFSFGCLIQATTYALHCLSTSVLQNALLLEASERRFW